MEVVNLYDNTFTFALLSWSFHTTCSTVFEIFSTHTQAFASLSNASIIGNGYLILLLSYVRFRSIRPSTLLLAMTFVFVGSASFAFHYSIAEYGSIRHTLDIYSAIWLVVYVAWLSVYSAIRDTRSELATLPVLLLIQALYTIQYHVWYIYRYILGVVCISFTALVTLILMLKMAKKRGTMFAHIYPVWNCCILLLLMLLAYFQQQSAQKYEIARSYKYDFMHGEWHLLIGLVSIIWSMYAINVCENALNTKITVQEKISQIFVIVVVCTSCCA